MARKPHGKVNNKPIKYEQVYKNSFHLEFLNSAQEMAWSAFQQNRVLFLVGPAGTGKTHLATAFAISDIVSENRYNMVLTRPLVGAGEKMGFLPGDLEEKVDPYMLPFYDCITTCVGHEGPLREKIYNTIEKAPLAFMRGRTFNDSVCIFDEAQNANYKQLKLFLTRQGKNSKFILTGDPSQTDLYQKNVALSVVMHELKTIQGVGIVEFSNANIVRDSIVAEILEKLENLEKRQKDLLD